MRAELIQKWDANKYKLEEYFKTTKQCEYSQYKTIVEKIIELVINEDVDSYPHCVYDVGKMTEIDNGDYQGTLLYAIPLRTYQPSETEYLFTYVSYGSCSGCDTLQAISCYSDELPTESQVKEYMTLALHLIQNMKKIEDFIDA